MIPEPKSPPEHTIDGELGPLYAICMTSSMLEMSLSKLCLSLLRSMGLGWDSTCHKMFILNHSR